MATQERPGAERWVPKTADIDLLRQAAAGCRGCELWRDATQTVFGDGAPTARIMLVGEQPGDREDLAGEPFVGPAGRILAEALEAAACHPWLEAELRAVEPAVVVCLGATAARAVLGRPVRIGAQRGEVIQIAGRAVVVTAHPAAVVRMRDADSRRAALDALIADLTVAAGALPAG